MIAELFPALYDIHGRRTFNPGTRGRRSGFRPTSSMGRYLTLPLKTHCKDFAELRKFLSTCRWKDMGEIQKRDYWQPPEEFEETKVGDCVDFGLWAWRQVLDMGYTARFVGGKAGKFGEGHAWVMFERDGKWFLLEPQLRHLGMRIPRISTLRYHPKVSVAWIDGKVQYFEHENRNTDPPFGNVPGLVAEWVFVWMRFWIRFSYRFPIALARRTWAKLRGLRGPT